MDKLFLHILNMSLTGGIVIVFIMLIRLLLKRAPKVFSYALWSVALFRLLCPFSFESVVSLLPVKSQPVPMDIALSPVPRIDSGFTPLDTAVNAFLPAPNPGDSANPMQIVLLLGEILWVAGIALLLAGSAVSYFRLLRRLKGAVLAEKGVYEVPGLETPFLLGIFRPRIYLPAGLPAEERQYALCHERTHLKRFDHLVKPLAYFALCLHWFNPLAWAAFFLMETDMELSCDESVLRQMGNSIKKGYSSSLLSMSAKGRLFSGGPLAFGEVRIKTRVKNVLRYKKPAFWALLAAMVLVAGTLLGLAVNPREKESGLNPDNVAAEFASLWKETLWPEELAKSPDARPNGEAFLEDLNRDGVPELFFLYDMGETAQGLVYRLDDGSYEELARFVSTGFQDIDRPIDSLFILRYGEGVTVFRSTQELYASTGFPQLKSVTEQYLIWKNGVLTSKTMEHMDSADGQTTYFNPDPSDDRLEISLQEYLSYQQSLLEGTDNNDYWLTIPGSYLVRDFLEGDALEEHLRFLLTQWRGQGHGNVRPAPESDGESGGEAPPLETGSSSTVSLVPQSLNFPDDPDFTLEFSAPSTWEFQEEEGGIAVYRYGGAIGHIQWSRFDIYPGVPEERFADMVYSTIRLGSIVYWEDYAEVVKTSHSASATATQYSAQILNNQSAAAARMAERPGIMAYEVDVTAFVTFCFEEGSIDPDELAQVAAGVSLKPKEETPMAMLNRWQASLQSEKGTFSFSVFSFQVPADCPHPEDFKIQVRGRAQMDGETMSFHDLEEKEWAAGENYQFNVEGLFSELILSASYGGETVDIDLWEMLPEENQGDF